MVVLPGLPARFEFGVPARPDNFERTRRFCAVLLDEVLDGPLRHYGTAVAAGVEGR